VVYLAWLGVRLWRAPPAVLGTSAGGAGGPPSHRGLAIQAFGVGISNPKAILYFTALFPQFVDPALPLLPQMATLATTFTAVEFCMIMSTASGAGSLAPWLAEGDRSRWINRLSGSILLAAAALLASVNRVA
jgi:threonine/homoserine/homoserine lactone efflux protein